MEKLRFLYVLKQIIKCNVPFISVDGNKYYTVEGLNKANNEYFNKRSRSK